MSRGFVSIALFSLLATACSSSSSTKSGACSGSGDCDAGQVCLDGGCRDLCTTQSDCAQGEVCTASQICAAAVDGDLPQITGVTGDDPGTPSAVLSGIVVSGSILGQAVFELRQGGTSLALSAVDQGDTRVALNLPADIRSGLYTLVATNAAGSAQAAVTLTLPELTGDVLLGRINSDATGTVAMARLPVGTTADSVAVGNHTHTAAEVGAVPAVGNAIALATDTTMSCGGASTAGRVRWNGGTLELCDGAAWVAVRTRGDDDGRDQQHPGASCKAIRTDYGAQPSGVYWIDPTGGDSADAFQVWCDMQTDGGGWTVIVNNDNGDAEPQGCQPIIATWSGAVCGTSIAPNSDFSVPASYIQFREMVWVGYAATFDNPTTYNYMTWNNVQSFPANSNAWFLKVDNTNQPIADWSLTKMFCTNGATAAERAINAVGNGIPGSGVYTGLVTFFTSSNDLTGGRMSFTDSNIGTGSQLTGLDDFQDGNGCSDTWQPNANRGQSSYLMVR